MQVYRVTSEALDRQLQLCLPVNYRSILSLHLGLVGLGLEI